MQGLIGIPVIGRRSIALRRTRALLARSAVYDLKSETDKKKNLQESRKCGRLFVTIPRLLRYAGVSLPVPVFLLICCCLGAGSSVLAGQICSVYATPLFFFAGAAFPFAVLDRRANKRAAAFSEEYSSVLLATASSLKSGMTAYAAMERAVRLLPKNSIVRTEVQLLLTSISKGVPRTLALEQFGATIRQPDLALFRTAFALALQHGGRFSPTLERLAEVCKDRVVLVRSAQVSTALMRMTANVLLALTPIILGMVALRTENYWRVFIDNPIANALGTTGLLLIGVSYSVLRSMSNFKP